VHLPLRAGTLLVKIHAHNQRTTQRSRDADELLPRRMVAQNISDDEFPVHALCRLNHATGAFGVGGQWLLHKDMTPGFDRGKRESFVCIWIGRDADRVRCETGQRNAHIVEQG
jgi:hypothetical protein